MSILCCILHSHKFFDRYQSVMETWGKDCDYIFCSDHVDYSRRIYQFSKSDSFASNEEKFVNLFKNIHPSLRQYDWYFICNDDTFVNVPLLEKFAETADEHTVYGQIISMYAPDPSLQYLSGGAGRLIPASIFKHAAQFLETTGCGYADVTFGYFMRNYGIDMIDPNLFHLEKPEVYGIRDCDVKKHITFHFVFGSHMKKLYTLCKQEQS